MYTFKDRNNDLLTLRPEYTTPMIRAAITNNLLIDLPLKIYGLGPMFREKGPQKAVDTDNSIKLISKYLDQTILLLI